MKNLPWLALALIAATSVSGCLQQDCGYTRKHVISPTQRVQAYLVTDPDGAALAQSGCTLILNQLKGFPEGANRIRKIADQRFSNHYSRCVQWVDSVRYTCDNDLPYPPYNPHPPYPGPAPTWAPPHPSHPFPQPPHPHPRGIEADDVYPGGYRCYPEPYTYCAQWEYDTTHDPDFAVTMSLASNLDLTFDKAQHLCGQVIDGNLAEGYSESRELLAFVSSQLAPQEQGVYSMACHP